MYSITSGNADVPQIRLQGKWLEKIGFKPNSKIVIEEKYGQLIIANQK